MAATIVFVWCLPIKESRASGIPVLCENCSDKLVQLLDRATNLEQLANMASQLNEMIIQTEQQIMLVKSEIERLASLPGGAFPAVSAPCQRFPGR